MSLAALLALIVGMLILLACGLLAAAALGPLPESWLESPILRNIAEQLGRLAAPLEASAQDELDQLMEQSGITAPDALDRFLVLRAVFALGLPLVALNLLPDLALIPLLTVVAVLGTLGYLVPRWWVESLRTARQARLRASIPQMMEYMLPLLEAGQSVDGVLRHLAQELRFMAPELSMELRRVIARMDAGMPRDQALKQMRARTGVDDLDSTLQMLARAEQSGASLLDAMRTQASATRERQLQLTEQRMAARAPILTIVTILFAMPILVVLLIGPAVVNAGNTLAAQSIEEGQP